MTLFKLGRLSAQWGGDVAAVMALSRYKGAKFYGLTWQWVALGILFLSQPPEEKP